MPNRARGTENTAGPADRPPVRLANSCSIVEGGERHQRDRRKYSITVGVVSIDNGIRLQLVVAGAGIGARRRSWSPKTIEGRKIFGRKESLRIREATPLLYGE